jgi:branched-chain amino acid transport system ATP-binding protein
MLELCDVSSCYGSTRVLRGVSLQVGDSSVAVLLGRNGMGKTTTVHSVIGFVRPESGVIRFRGKVISGLNPYEIARMGIALVPQGRRIFRSLTVHENLSIVPVRRGAGKLWSLERVYSVFPRLKERAKLRAGLLSGGEQQMLSIGRALLANPELILMDEPSEGLAPYVVREVGEIIKLIKADGVSLLLVEQNLYLGLSTSDYAYVIENGEIVYEATIDMLSEDKAAQDKYLAVS